MAIDAQKAPVGSIQPEPSCLRARSGAGVGVGRNPNQFAGSALEHPRGPEALEAYCSELLPPQNPLEGEVGRGGIQGNSNLAIAPRMG